MGSPLHDQEKDVSVQFVGSNAQRHNQSESFLKTDEDESDEEEEEESNSDQSSSSCSSASDSSHNSEDCEKLS